MTVSIPNPSLLRKLGLFLLLPAPLLFALWWQFEAAGKYQADPLYGQQRAFLAAPRQLDYLVIGNSRARQGIDVAALGNAFSLATPGESFVETHGHLRYVLEHTDKRVGTVILPIGLGSLKPMGFRRGHYWVRFVDYLDVGWRNGQPLRYLGGAVEDRLLPYRFVVQRWLAGPDGQRGRNETNPDADPAGSLADLDAAARQRQLAHHLRFIRDAGLLDAAALHYLEDMLRLLRVHRVRSVFVKFPIAAPLLDAMRGLAGEQGYPEQRIDALIGAQPGARLLDYQTLFAGRDALFEDLNHLNAAGRRLLTERLMRDLAQASVTNRASPGRRPDLSTPQESVESSSGDPGRLPADGVQRAAQASIRP